tara:strand:- start:16 stop:510 length:495 start_codon:yes stop_codon:yes gene_type:complete
MTIQIKKLQTKDWKIWKELRLEALKFSPDTFGSSYADTLLWSDEKCQKMLTDHDLFGAFMKNTLIGISGFFIYEPEKMKHRGCLFGLYIRETHRNKGAANLLVKQIITQASGKVIQLHCTVTTDNAAAIKLYQKHGFEIYGTEPRSLKVENRFHDEHFMVLKFD